MKTKYQTLTKKIEEIKGELNAVSFERKDTSKRRSKGYFGTKKAKTSDVIVVETFARTRYLNTYVCVAREQQLLVDRYNEAKAQLETEKLRLLKIAQRKWASQSIIDTTKLIENDIDSGIIHTNYGKRLFVGNSNIYYAHPHYGHNDYNKAMVMPNTAKHRKIAVELNQRIENALLTTKQTNQ